MKLTHQHIVLTGGTSGVGLALLRQLHHRQNTLLVVARNETTWNALAPDFPNATFIQADLANPTDLDALLLTLQRDHAHCTVLINNAGVQYNYCLGDDPETHWKIDREVQINLTAAMQLCEALLPRFRQQAEAAIVNVTSGLALSPKRSAAVYCATKAGLRVFTKALRYQLAGTRVGVYEAMLPLVDTPMTAGRGRGKISPEQVATEITVGVEAGRAEINVGKVKLFRLLYRLWPAGADRLLKNG